MVFSLNTDLGQRLDGLLTNTNSQAREVAFNIQFSNLQNTAIERLNKEIEDAANVAGNQRELDALRKTYNKFVADRESIVNFAFVNQSNRDRLNELTTLATNTLSAFSLGDTDVENLSADEVSNYETNLADIVALADRMVELSHPDFVDGNNITRIRSLVSDLQGLTAVEGVIDDEGTDPATNDNLAISEFLSEIATASGGASDTSSTLETSARKNISLIDGKLKSIDAEMDEISVFRAGEIEFEIQMLRTEYANFLRSIEIAFDFGKQGTNALVEALEGGAEPDPGSIVSILV